MRFPFLQRRSDSSHPTVDELEDYSLGRFDSLRSARIEGHLHRCTRCSAIVAKTPVDDFVGQLRDAEPSAAPVDRSLPMPPEADFMEDVPIRLTEILSSPALVAPLLTLLASLFVLYAL